MQLVQLASNPSTYSWALRMPSSDKSGNTACSHRCEFQLRRAPLLFEFIPQTGWHLRILTSSVLTRNLPPYILLVFVYLCRSIVSLPMSVWLTVTSGALTKLTKFCFAACADTLFRSISVKWLTSTLSFVALGWFMKAKCSPSSLSAHQRSARDSNQHAALKAHPASTYPHVPKWVVPQALQKTSDTNRFWQVHSLNHPPKYGQNEKMYTKRDSAFQLPTSQWSQKVHNPRAAFHFFFGIAQFTLLLGFLGFHIWTLSECWDCIHGATSLATALRRHRKTHISHQVCKISTEGPWQSSNCRNWNCPGSTFRVIIAINQSSMDKSQTTLTYIRIEARRHWQSGRHPKVTQLSTNLPWVWKVVCQTPGSSFRNCNESNSSNQQIVTNPFIQKYVWKCMDPYMDRIFPSWMPLSVNEDSVGCVSSRFFARGLQLDHRHRSTWEFGVTRWWKMKHMARDMQKKGSLTRESVLHDEFCPGGKPPMDAGRVFQNELFGVWTCIPHSKRLWTLLNVHNKHTICRILFPLLWNKLFQLEPCSRSSLAHIRMFINVLLFCFYLSWFVCCISCIIFCPVSWLRNDYSY